MTTYDLDDSEFEALKGKTIIVTGGASGIGRAAVQIAYSEREFSNFSAKSTLTCSILQSMAPTLPSLIGTRPKASP